MAAPSLIVQIQGQGSVSADQLNTYQQTCDTIAQLRAFVGAPGVQVYVRGISVAGDGGQGVFVWVANVTGSDNGNSIIVPTATASGYWERLSVDSSVAGAIACTETGTNAIVLTPINGVPQPFVYANYQSFIFVAQASSTSTVTAQVGSLPALNVYTATNVQAGAGSLIAGQLYMLVYNSALNVGAGGFVLTNSSASKQPTLQKFTSGSGTYTTPAGCTRIVVTMAGAGGGGAGSGTTPGAATAGGNTTFSTFSANGGSPGVTNGGGAGGSCNCDVAFSGQAGTTVNTIATQIGGAGGGSSLFGGGGTAGASGASTGGTVVANTGGGGGGAGCGATTSAGGGGGAGGSGRSTITAPAATYSYSVGTGGTGGTLGASGAAGATGANGIIIVDEFYN